MFLKWRKFVGFVSNTGVYCLLVYRYIENFERSKECIDIGTIDLQIRMYVFGAPGAKFVLGALRILFGAPLPR